jgi:hypothetical protein
MWQKNGKCGGGGHGLQRFAVNRRLTAGEIFNLLKTIN